jgi:acetylornithine/succinyldiaminopimelate/putrescine aminotransferase
MIAVDFHNTQTNFKTIATLLEQGLFSDWFLWCNTAMRISPPLILNDEDLKEVEASFYSFTEYP